MAVVMKTWPFAALISAQGALILMRAWAGGSVFNRCMQGVIRRHVRAFPYVRTCSHACTQTYTRPLAQRACPPSPSSLKWPVWMPCCEVMSLNMP